MNATTNRTLKSVLAAAVLVTVAIGAYVVGRRSSIPLSVPAPAAEEHHEAEEAGVIKFDADSLRLADLKV